MPSRSSLTKARPALILFTVGVSTAVALAGCSSSPTSTPSSLASSASATTSSPTTGSDIVGTWRADASEILGANTANVGGAGGLSCTGPITMKFTDAGQFSRAGRVTCTVAGTSKSGAVASAGSYTTSGDTLTISGYRSTGSIPDSFGGASATYSVAGDTLTITFNGGSAGTITQTYQRA